MTRDGNRVLYFFGIAQKLQFPQCTLNCVYMCKNNSAVLPKTLVEKILHILQ